MLPFRLSLRALRGAAALALASVLAVPAAAQTAWLTLDDPALRVLQKVSPKARVLASADVRVTVPEQRGTAARFTEATDRVHAVEVEEIFVEMLSVMNHRELRRCAGFVRHDSMAEALATLHRVETASRSGRRGEARAPSYAIDDTERASALLARMQASNILSSITQLQNFQNRRYNSSYGVAASDWLLAQWRALLPFNRDDVRIEQVTHPGWPQKSVMFEFMGRGPNRTEVLVVGAHLDSIAPGGIEGRAPGADDDASGIASLTEIIRVLANGNFRPSRTVRFYAYAAEEVGLWGSQALAAQAVSAQTNVIGVLQLDMTAFQGDSTDIWIYTDYTNPAQNAFLASLVQAYLPGLSVGYDRCGYGCSDHAAWHNRGFVASFPHEASNATFNRALHTVNDTTATFGNQANHAIKFARLAMAWVVELGTD